MTALVLSLFPGIGLLDRGFEDEGFCVVRGPDLLWGGDVKKFHVPAGRFDGVIGGPPCQAFSSLRHLVLATGGTLKPNLIPEYERVCGEAEPAWFLMENVPDAPEPVVSGYVVKSIMLNNRWVPREDGANVGPEQNRLRRFSFGTLEGLALKPHVALWDAPRVAGAILGPGGPNRPHVAIGGSGKKKRPRFSSLPPIPTVTANGTEWDPAVLNSHGGPTGIVLDPPYAQDERAGNLYACESEVSAEVRAWAIEHGADGQLRIVLCGYEGEHDMPSSWRVVEWKAGGGYGRKKGNNNRHRERLWFSPACASARQGGLFA